jgi:signal transduction histidine kinase
VTFRDSFSGIKKLAFSDAPKALAQAQELRAIVDGASDLIDWYLLVSFCHYRASDYGESLRDLLMAMDLARADGKPAQIAEVAGSAGLTCWSLGDYQRSIEFFEEAIRLAEDAGDEEEVARSKANLGLVYYSMGNLDIALEVTLESANTPALVETSHYRNRALNNCATIMWERDGPTDEALKMMQEVVAIKATESDNWSYVLSLCNLSGLLRDRGEFDAAEASLKEAFGLLQNVESKERWNYYYLNQGALLADPKNPRRDAAEGYRLLDLCLDPDRLIPSPDFAVKVLDILHKAKSADGDWESAFQYLKRVSEIRQKTQEEGQRRRLENLRIAHEVNIAQEKLAAENLQRKELEEKHIALQAASNLNEDLLSVISHDVRGPVGTIQFLVECALSGDMEMTEALHDILTLSQETFTTLENLLKLRAAEGAGVEAIESIDFPSFWQTLTDSWKRSIAQKKLHLHTDIPAGLRLTTMPTWLRPIFENLLSNAIKYSPPGKNIRMQATPEGDFVEFRISDEGSGVPPEKRDYLFGRFSKAGSEATGGESSSGLGLFIVKQLTQRLGGSIAYEANEAGGACFVLRLPTGRPETKD